MAAPLALTLGVDLEEYSRFEPDKNTINVAGVASVATTDLSADIAIGVTTLPVDDVSLFPSTFPFDVMIGTGVNQETRTVNGAGANSFNLTVATTIGHKKCDPVVHVSSFTGEQVQLQLMKARRNRDVVVATETVTLSTGLGPQPFSSRFYLPDVVDQRSASRVRRGSYYVRAISITNPTVTGNTPDFLVSIMTVDRFKSEFLHGVDQQALDTEMVKNQPVLVTGVTVSFVSRGHQKGWIPFSYNYSNPAGCATPVRLLSWCDGPTVAIRAGQTKYTLRRGKSQSDYIDVVIPNISALPTQTTAEDLLIDRETLKDEFFRSMLDRSIDWVEDTALMCFLEPTRVVTEIDPNEITYAAGTDIPTFVQADWDKKVQAVTYTPPSGGNWINFRMPFYPIIDFNSLYGKMSNVRIVDIALEWVEKHENGGWVELVPFNQELAFNFIGLAWVQATRGPKPLPNFWNFDAIVGYRQLPQVIIELVAKKAAIDALTVIGQAFRPGISSQSVSRDGVSESVSYLTSGQYGIFSATIKTYSEWLDKNLPMLRGAYKGVNMVVV